MSETQAKENPEFLNYVYRLTAGSNYSDALTNSLLAIDELDLAQLNRIGQNTYAANKWTLHNIFQHLIDWERIWCFRAILFARQEGSTPEAHDQEIMAANDNAEQRAIEDLIEELKIVRQSSILLFNSIPEDLLENNCAFFEYHMPLHSIGLTIAAHQIHHFKVIEERYLPLLQVE